MASRRSCMLALMASLALGRASARAASPPPAAALRAQVEQILRAMTVQQKVAQLLLIGFGGQDINPFLEDWVGRRHVGGVALFGRNLQSAPQIRRLTQGLVDLPKGGVTPFVAIDQEGGPVLRLRRDFAVLPGAMVLGAAHKQALAYAAGRATASDLLRLGFNMNFAPVLDVNSNADNPVINVRSFGERPADVARLGRAFVSGQSAVGLASVVKHFPGHGDTSVDSHFSLPRIDADAKHLARIELPPFVAAIDAGVDAIMTAHIALPRVTHEGELPATLSKAMLTDWLRHKLGFDGIVITDGLEMQGVAQRFGVGPSAVRAVLAGADMPMVLWSDEACEEAYQALLAAVHKGTLGASRLDASVRRILLAKARRGLLDGRFRSHAAGNDEAVGEHPVHAALMRRVAEDGVTLWQADGASLPTPAALSQWLVVAPEGLLLERMRREGGCQTMVLPNMPSRAQREQGSQRLARAMAGHVGVVAAVANRYHVDMVQAALEAQPGQATVLVSMASPYWLAAFADAGVWLATYSTLPAAQGAVADVLLGEREAHGTPPVTVSTRPPAR